ncbi:MAG: metal ABC transporter substrate-binding protein [Geminicoccaceae bacterium]
MPLFRRAVLALALAALAAPASAQERLPVVASFSILGDMTARIGGERIALTTLVGPDGDAHVFQPGPVDARALVDARMLVVNGLGFEGWIDRLKEASGFHGVEVTTTAGIEPLTLAEDGEHGHGPFDPHAWQDVANAEIFVRNIVAGLERADPDGAVTYRANAEGYLAELRALDEEIRSAIARVPEAERVLVTSHDAFGYFAHAYGVTMLAPQGVSTESEASAGEVARLIGQIRAERVQAVFVENISDPRLVDQIVRETGARIGGTLYSDALSPPGTPAATYLGMMRHNAAQITAALQS